VTGGTSSESWFSRYVSRSLHSMSNLSMSAFRCLDTGCLRFSCWQTQGWWPSCSRSPFVLFEILDVAEHDLLHRTFQINITGVLEVRLWL
jgi:hypothetical protein